MAADVASLAAELAAHLAAEARMAAALVELEGHPGHVMLAAGRARPARRRAGLGDGVLCGARGRAGRWATEMADPESALAAAAHAEAERSGWQANELIANAELAAADRVHDLLWTRPCDLAAATVAVVEYQRLVRDGG